MNKDKLLDLAMDACVADDYIGYCICCGAEHHNIEPDARKYECEECGNGIYVPDGDFLESGKGIVCRHCIESAGDNYFKERDR